jgi:hypothetical protein
MKILTVFSLLLVASGSSWSEPPLDERTENKEDRRILSSHNFWTSWEKLTFQGTFIAQWNGKRDSAQNRALQADSDESFAGEDMIVMVSFDEISKLHDKLREIRVRLPLNPCSPVTKFDSYVQTKSSYSWR